MTTKETTEPAPKRARHNSPSETILQEAFANGRTLSSFQCLRVLRFDAGGKFIILQGTLPNSNDVLQPALIQLEQMATCNDPEQLTANLPNFQLQPTNYSGAEYSFYKAVGLGATFNMEVIWPATERQIQRKIPAEKLLVEETSELYFQKVQQFAEEQSLHIGWLDAVVNLKTELERNLFHNDRFVINVDTKWTTHAEPLSTDTNIRQTWHGAKWTDALYLLAIVKDPSLKSIRDLKGEQGALLCEEMRDELRKVAQNVYGVHPSQLRIMFHYHPQFYRLHAHCVRIHAINPGSETERAHLLTTVASNLRMNEDYYSLCTLSYSVRVGERLHTLLKENNGVGLV
jgi:m7GpppX diphosphatase